jgi:hypothetical protein
VKLTAGVLHTFVSHGYSVISKNLLLDISTPKYGCNVVKIADLVDETLTASQLHTTVNKK